VLIPVEAVAVLIVTVLVAVALFQGVLPPENADIGMLAGAWCLIAGSQLFSYLSFPALRLHEQGRLNTRATGRGSSRISSVAE
jgi:hypothetical protein